MSAPIRGLFAGDRFGASEGGEGIPPGKRLSAQTAWREARSLFARHRGRLAINAVLVIGRCPSNLGTLGNGNIRDAALPSPPRGVAS